MPKYRGAPPTSGASSNYGSDEFYRVTKTTVYPSRETQSGTTSTGGVSSKTSRKYATPELEAAYRPYADVGKVNLNLFDPAGEQETFQRPPQPGATDIMRGMQAPWMDKSKGESIGDIPGMALIGGGIDFLSNIAGSIPELPTPQASMLYQRLRETPDAQLSESERTIKSANAGLFAAPPDSPIMQGKQVAEMYKEFQQAEAHRSGSSAMLNPQAGSTGPIDYVPIMGSLFRGYGQAANILRRGFGSVPWADQLQELKNPDATEKLIGEERWAIRESLLSGEINDEEARDLIALSSFALSNPDPIKIGDEFGPLDTIANAALALAGEFITDPASLPAIAASGGSWLAAKPVTTTLKSITRTVASDIVAQSGKDVATAAGREAYETAIQQITKEATELAAKNVGQTAASRYLPKAATQQAKAIGTVGADAVNERDIVEALLDMGASNHPNAASITKGLNAAGTSGFIASRATTLVRVGQSIDKMTDPFSLFGYWKTGAVVPGALSKQAATGGYDALGWRVTRRLSRKYEAAGLDPDAMSRAREIALANHTIQAGDHANTARMVATSSSVNSGMTPTEAALQHAGRRPGDIRRLVRDQVDRTLEFIVPTEAGGRAAATLRWQERAATQLIDFGADPDAARRVAATMDEREMRVLANDHWALMIETLDSTKRAAAPTGKWTADGINRITFVSTRQMSEQQARGLAAAIAQKNVGAVRAAVRRFKDLNANISEGLDDNDLLDAVDALLRQLKGSHPTVIEDLSALPQGLQDWAKAHPGYQLMLRPSDNNLMVPIRNKDGRITGVKSWVDNVTLRTPSIEVTKQKAWREGLFRGISGGEIERNAARRFSSNMGEYVGLSEAESASVLRAVREAAAGQGGSPRGLTTDAIFAAVDNAKGLSPQRKVLARRGVLDAIFDAYENEARLVGMTPKATGWVKKHGHNLAGNAIGWATDYLYPTVRFMKNPIFFIQEVPEAAFFLALMGRYPITNVVPDPIAEAISNVPVLKRISQSKERTRIWNEKTMVVMDRMNRVSPNADYDAYEAIELLRMGLISAADVTDRRTPLGRLLRKSGQGELPARKRRSVALAGRYELGEQWKRSLLRNNPEQWLATRAFYPDEMSDGEVAVQWSLDMMARADPDGVYSIDAPDMFNPSHIGRRAEVSDHLVRRFVYGEADMANHTWDSMVNDVRTGKVSIDHVKRDLMNAGADPDYVERTVRRLEFGTPEEFYQSAIDLGISEPVVDAWRASNRTAAGLQNISEVEYLTRNFVGRPLHTNQMGNIVGDTLFDDIVENMRVRGKNVPAGDSKEVAAQMKTANDMIREVLPTTGRWQDAIPPQKGEPVPDLELEVIKDPPPYLYEPVGPNNRPGSEFGSDNGYAVVVRNPGGEIVGSIEGGVDENGFFDVAMVKVKPEYRRKGVANWMYRQFEEQTGITVAPSKEQLGPGRSLWAQADRPFGPRQRTIRQFMTGIEDGQAVPLGEVQRVDPITLPEFDDIPEEYWPPDVDYFMDPKLEKMQPVQMTADGRIIGQENRARVQAARQQGVRVPVQLYDYPTATSQADARKAATKVKSWMNVRDAREADPTLGAPPMVVAEDGSRVPLYQTELHTIGEQTPEQYLLQIETMMDPELMAQRGLRAMTEKDALNAIEWYDHIRRAQFALVDENLSPEQRIQEAARLLVAFGTTQLNTSPADGFRHVARAYGMRARGETLQLDEARNIVQQAVGLNPEQLQALVWGRAGKIEQMGIAQKLFDFIDSLTGAKTRTNGVTGPNGNWGPVAVDIHTKRDFGFLDPAMGSWVYRVVERRGTDGQLIHGVSSKFVTESGGVKIVNGEEVDTRVGHFVVEMSDGSTDIIPKEQIGQGVPTNYEYDYGVEMGNAIRDHLNDINFMGRQWSSYEVQALGWYRMQLLKSSEGDMGTVANAMFEQSRWMGSNDIVPSANAPLHEVHNWDILHPTYHRAIHVEGAYHASDEAEIMTGARVLTKMDSDAVVGGTYRPAQTVELVTDNWGAEQYLAHYLYLSEQDSGVLMRDYVGAGARTGTPRYDKGVGISVDIPAKDKQHADYLLSRYAAEEGSPLRSIGSHSFIARDTDGGYFVRTLWQPGGAKAGRNEFKAALKASGLDEMLQAEDGMTSTNTLVDFIALSHDWKADPSGKTYTDLIQRGSGKHGVVRSAEQRGDLIRPYDEAYDGARQRVARAKADVAETAKAAKRANASQKSKDASVRAQSELKAATKALGVAKKEMEVARAAPAGRPASEVSELVGSARVRVRETVRAGFDKYAAREVRNERERVLGEARDAAGASLGTDPTVGDVLSLARGSNGEYLYERSPNGTVRAAVTRESSNSRRAQLYFNRGVARDSSALHELIHVGAWEMDDSAVRSIKGVYAGLEGTAYGTHTPGAPLTEAEHEWLISQYFLWVDNPDSVHPVLAPLMNHFTGKLGSARALKTQATEPSREAVKRIDGEIAALQVRLGKAKSLKAKTQISADIAGKMAERNTATREAKALRAQGGLHPDVKRVLDEIASKAGERTDTRVSTFNADEANMMEWAQISMAAASRRANNLVHMRGERSAFERSLNHPFLMMYPTSYMYGKVLPYMAEFLLARPFGMKAPFVAYTMGQSMHQSFQRQQQYDEELRNFLYKNEPFLRAMSLFVPGLPWDLPAGFPFWGRRIIENMMTNQQRAMSGLPPEEMNYADVIVNSALYNLTLRGPDQWGDVVDSIGKAPEIGGAMLTGEVPEPVAPTP